LHHEHSDKYQRNWQDTGAWRKFAEATSVATDCPSGTIEPTGAGEIIVLVGIDKKFWLMVLSLAIALILLAAWAMRSSG